MIKSGLAITAYVTIVSGCAFVDSPQTEVEARADSAVVAFEPVSAISETEVSTVMPAQVATPRSLTPDDIRRMQVRLRDVGLDPGPVDGFAGGKTKAAVKRFQFGCAQLQSLLDGSLSGSQSSSSHGVSVNKRSHFAAGVLPPALLKHRKGDVQPPLETPVNGSTLKSAWSTINQVPVRQETLSLQIQLRSAGFSPGPADGIFGGKLKTILTHLQNGCPVAQEFVALLDQPAETAGKITLAGNPAERPSATRIIAAQSRLEAAKQLAAPIAVRPQEDIRILQLRLRDAGYDPGPFDGVMGPKTKLALQQMQASQRSGKAKNTVTAGIGIQY